jgi:hypothetical protein
MNKSEQETKKYMNKDDAIKTLEIVNMWINSFDTKTSIILTLCTVFISLFLSSEYIGLLKDIVIASLRDVNIFSCLYIIIILISLSFIIFGIGNLVAVIIPRKVSRKKKISSDDSLMFYASIAKNKSVNEYQKKAEKYTQDNLFNDILFQIHSCARICNKKHKLQRYGIIFSAIGILILALLLVIGYVVYSL